MTTQNRQLVQQALSQLIGEGGVTALEPLLSDDFRHHRPDALTRTKTEWLTDVGNALTPLAELEVEILHLLSDEDHVIVHTRRHLPGGGPTIAVVDILRIADHQIAEAWELIEPATEAESHLTWWKQ
ncbi:nuclear transport factor 2 family protein [Streptomyces sp. SID13031]|uniref:nuclear transport factor 2 family protein n=1 Tax=Streptomyces sp. SID13031 TaxID=2706046 RepID=UPI0013CAD1AB|nr:nuclear transport factor 2 family protein [Streptomyces sp. SID13031]NEA32391.1 nuclear transport factor 2 family protein [Streptomyces sp. SID13031]